MSVTLRGVTHTPPQGSEEPTFYLNAMAPKRRRTGLIVGLVAAGVLVVAGGAAGIGYALAGKDDAAGPAAASTPSSAPPPTATTATATPTATTGGGTAREACAQFSSFSHGIADDNYGPADLPALKSIAGQAAASDDSFIAASGKFLSATIDLAIAAHGQADEAKSLGKVKEYARNLRKSCALAGYPT